MNKIKKNLAKASAGIGAITALTVGSVVSAAPNAEYASGTEAIKSTVLDNNSTTIGYVVAIIGGVFIVSLVIRAAFFGKNQGLSVFGSRRKRR